MITCKKGNTVSFLETLPCKQKYINNATYPGSQRSVVHPSGNWILWSCKDSSQVAVGSLFPVGEGECHDTRRGDP